MRPPLSGVLSQMRGMGIQKRPTEPVLPTNESKLKRVSQGRLSQVTQSVRSDIYTAEVLTGHSLITLHAVQITQ